MDSRSIRGNFIEALSPVYSKSEALELWLIFAEKILEKSRFELRQNFEISAGEQEELRVALAHLKTGQPYQQVLGEAWFFGMKFFVNENVLIPRPETEELLELAIEDIQKANFITQNLKILDIGTGSGIIPIVLKKRFPDAEVFALDFSEKALDVARKNAELHGTDLHFIHQDYLNASLQQRFDVIVSNPPYISKEEAEEIDASVKDFEPPMALFSPTSDPLVFYRKIAIDGLNYLNPDGRIFLEINQKLGRETLELFGGYARQTLLKDLSGNGRFIVAVL